MPQICFGHTHLQYLNNYVVFDMFHVSVTFPTYHIGNIDILFILEGIITEGLLQNHAE